MKKIILSVLIFSNLVTFNLFALNYSIHFTSSGKSAVLDSVTVINLTKGYKITTTDSVLLTNEFNSTNSINNEENIKITPTPNLGTYIVEFNSLNTGTCHFRILSADGKVFSTSSKNIDAGSNKIIFNAMPGLNIIHIFGMGYNYASKIINTGKTTNYINKVNFIDNYNNSVSPSKIKAQGSGKVLFFSAGDKILVKGFSGNYSNIIIDSPASSKTINFVQTECKDAEGNYYTTVKIGNKVWMAENLKTTKYKNGDNIVNFSGNSDWGFYSIGSYCLYNNDISLKTYGLLYNWYTIKDSRGIAPEGWHVAKDAEWSDLATILGGESLAGSKIKETGTLHWLINNNATNESGFTGLPSGLRLASGTFSGLGANSNWWTDDENSTTYSWYRYINSSSNNIYRDYYNKNTGFAVRCVKDPDQPTIQTLIPGKTTYTTTTSGCIILSDGGSTITSIGVCFGINPNPTLTDNKTIETNNNDTIVSKIYGLNPGTKYFIRAYATTTAGTVYGDEIEATTQDYDTIVTDIDGNAYHVITIGTQTWMAENLKTTRLNDSTVIPMISDANIWSNTSTPAYCYYNNIYNNYITYGAMYNWYAVGTGKLAPLGWHVASDAEWTVLTNYLGGYNTAGGKVKETGNAHWITPNTGATNESGFNGLPGGGRGNNNGTYLQLGEGGFMWTSTSQSDFYAYFRSIGYYHTDLARSGSGKTNGMYVRCIKNTLPQVTTNTATGLFSTKATVSATLVNNGGDSNIEVGVCWDTLPNPDKTHFSRKFVDQNLNSGTIDNLIPNKKYYLKAYATNSEGTVYGNEISFTTLLTDPETAEDVDGNVYQTIKIGDQIWMVENLKTTKYNDGTPIALTTSGYDWLMQTSGAYCWPQDNSTYKSPYGVFYNWYAVNSGKLAPTGWHIPTESDWLTLQAYLGGTDVAGGKLKATGTTYWYYPNTGATNESGFTAIPAGYRSKSSGGNPSMGEAALFWSSTGDYNNYGRVAINSSNSIFSYALENGNFGFNVRCIKNSKPIIETNSATHIDTTSLQLNGTIISDCGDSITEYGFCYSTNKVPDIADTKIIASNLSSGVFYIIADSLTSNTEYQIRAFAINKNGISYGNLIKVKTLKEPELVVDIDGNVYHTVTIGTQTWMVENLKTTRYRNGDSIPNISNNSSWASSTSGAYCDYNNLVENGIKYGHFYNWYAINDSRNVAPVGWHVPTDAEWTILTSFLGGESITGGKIKEIGTTNWESPNMGATNESGFTAMPGGNRGNGDGTYSQIGTAGFWWTSSMLNSNFSYFRSLSYSHGGIGRSGSPNNNGLHIRCIKNQ